MSLKTQDFADPNRYNASPGPANYNPNFKAMYRNFSYTMRSRPKTAKADSNPGPGNYDLRTEKSLMAPTYKYELYPFVFNFNFYKKQNFFLLFINYLNL